MTMSNQTIKDISRGLHLKIVNSGSPDAIMDYLFSKHVINEDDYYRLRQVPVSRDRCRDMLSLLYLSSHPQAFIYLRLALLHGYPWIVDEIDNDIPSLTSQLQQLQLNCSSDGKDVYVYVLFLSYLVSF